MQRDFQKAGNTSAASISKSFGREMPKVEKAIDKATAASGKFIVEQEKLNAVIAKGGNNRAEVIRQSERVATAYRNESSAIRNVTQSLQSIQDGGSMATTSMTAFASSLRAVGTVGGPVIIGGIVVGLTQLAGVAASASGAIGLLPGAIGGAAAAFGTLKLATIGFSDALESMGDPEKFAEAIKKLSPAAQQAVLSIQSLMPEFTKLKDATQDALFANIGPQLTQFTNTLMPTVQQATTGIAGAFNQMFMGLTNQLMAPDTMAALNTFTDNVVKGFQNLTPAVAPLTKAFADIAATGSGFFPQMAQGAADLAQSFSQFISEARATGQLNEWMQTGLDIVKQMGPLTLNLAEAFLSLAPVGERIMPMIVEASRILADLMPIISTTVAGIGPLFGTWAADLQRVGMVVQALKFSIEKVGDMIAFVKGPEAKAQWDLTKAQANAANPWVGGGGVFGPGGVGGGPGGTGPGGLPLPFSGGVGGSLRAGDWLSARAATATPGGLPRLGSPAAGGGAVSDTERREAIRAGLDPNQFMPALPPMGAAGPGTDPQAVIEAQQRIQSEAWDVQNARMDLAVLEQDTLATQQELLDARRKVQEEEWGLQNAAADLNQSMQAKTKEFASGLEDVGAALDSDFGLGEGLPGLAKNLTMFLANLAAAPILGQLQAGIQVNEAATGIQGGHGLLGVMGAQNLAAGRSPLLGRPLPAAAMGQSAIGPAALQPSNVSALASGAYPGDAALLANVRPGRYSQDPSRDLLKGLSDCSSSIGDLVGLLDTGSTAGPNLTTHNAATWLPQHGFLPGMGGPGDFRVGFNAGHMQATLPGGTPWNWGSDASAARGGVGGSGAFDPAFTNHYYRPAGAGGTPPAAGGWGGGSPQLGISGGGGQSPVLPQAGPGVGAGLGQQPTRIGGISPASQGGGGGGLGITQGGAIDTAIGMAASAADVFAPGAGQAMQVGMKLANRAIQYGGEVAGIGVSGLMETFLPTGGSQLANNNWLTRLAGGIAGAAPALPNLAGQGGEQQTAAGQAAAQGDPNLAGFQNQPTNGVYIENYQVGQSEDRAGADLARHQQAANSAPGM